MNPFSPSLRLGEAIHQWDFILFNVVGALNLPVYIAWLLMQYGAFMPTILIAMQTGIMTIDALILAASAWWTSMSRKGTELKPGCRCRSRLGGSNRTGMSAVHGR